MLTRAEVIREQENVELILNLGRAYVNFLLRYQAFLVEMEPHIKDESEISDLSSPGIET